MSISSNTIITPKPPLNLFEANRLQLQGNDWFTVLDAPKYIIPASALTPQSQVNTAVIMTGLTISNVNDASDITISVRIIGTDNNAYTVLSNAPIPANDFMFVGLDRQVIVTGEKLQVSCTSNITSSNDAVVHFSFIINQRESFTQVN